MSRANRQRESARMKCNFCGCTDARACAIPMLITGEDDVVGRATSIALAGAVAQFTTPCHWIAPNVCSAPACVEQAYREICAREDLEGRGSWIEAGDWHLRELDWFLSGDAA